MTLELKHPKSEVQVSSARAFHDASRPSHCFGLWIPGFILGALCALASVLSAAVPQLLNHQGRIAVNGTNFEGAGQFKFALVNSTGSTTYWSNDGTSTAGSQPTAAVSLPVVKGLYAVLLGDTALANMTTLPTTVFENADVRLRVWFNDGTNGFQHITPDQRLASAPFAMNAAQAESVPDASITNTKLARSNVSVIAGAGLSGGGSVSLGSSVTLTNAGVLSLSGGGGVTVSGSTGAVTLGSNATSSNTPATLVLRDGSGNFSAGTITASLSGNATTATSATDFSGPLTGDVTGTQNATTIAAATITGKAITGFASSPGTLTASDSILNAINKLDGNIALRAPLVSPSFTGIVTGTFSGNGSALTNLSGASITAGTVGSAQIADLSIVNADLSAAAAIAYSKLNLAGAIVDADISSSAAIGDGKLATLSTAGKVANSATTGTAANSPSTLVLRDASGNFTAGTINGTFVGNGSGLTGVTASSVLLNSVIAPPIRPVVAWGRNNAGQTALPGTLSQANTAAIAAGGDTSVALLKTGTVVQWGSGTAVPAGLANVTHIAAGTSHRLARRSDGTVVAWGGNAYNQSTVPGGLTTATTIAAGEKHSLALRADGTVLAWGDNTFTQTTVPGTATNVIAIAAGYDHSLALKADGTVVAWGRDDSGQVTGSYPSVGVILAIIDSTRFRLSTQLASGTSQLRYDGTTLLTSVGDGSDIVTVADTSSLSQGMAVTRPDLVGPSGLTDVIAIACGAYHSLAVKSDGSVVAWGWDGGGQVSGAASLTGISRIAGGYAFTLALKNDGTLVAFGDNTDLQLNVPSSTASITAIACGASHALALRADLIPAQVARLDQDNVFTGNVGIKRSPAANTLEVEGQASKTTAGNWLANSDRRIKDNVKPITGALEKLSKVRLVDFNYTPDYLAAHPGIEPKRYLNVIAQEFAEVFPEDVKSSGETLPDGSPILQVDTYPLTIYSAAAVQELAKENEQLKKQLAEQETRLKKLEEAIK
jgi:hypothetical protein